MLVYSRLYDLLKDSEKVKGNSSPRPRETTGYPDPFNSVLKILWQEEVEDLTLHRLQRRAALESGRRRAALEGGIPGSSPALRQEPNAQEHLKVEIADSPGSLLVEYKRNEWRKAP
jgi:hypothetical protein